MSKYLAFIFSCLICIIFDIAARQTLLLGSIYLLPCLLIATGMVVIGGERRTPFLIISTIVSVVYGMLLSLNWGAVILSLVLSFLIWELISKLTSLPISSVMAQILIFFNVLGLILMVTKSRFSLGQYIAYLFLNTLISLVLYVVVNRVGISRTEPRLKYK